MTGNDSKSYLPNHSIKKKPIKDDNSALIENIESNSKAPKFKLHERVRMIKYQKIFSKGYTENWSREILTSDSLLKIDS